MASGNVLARFTPLQAVLPSANNAFLSDRNGTPVLVFPDAERRYALFYGNIPDTLAVGGNITVNIYHVEQTTGNVRFTAEFCRMVEASASFNIDSSGQFAAGLSATGAAEATVGRVANTAIALTNAEADALAAGDAFCLRISREGANAADTLLGDAQVLAVTFKQT